MVTVVLTSFVFKVKKLLMQHYTLLILSLFSTYAGYKFDVLNKLYQGTDDTPLTLSSAKPFVDIEPIGTPKVPKEGSQEDEAV